jgi:4-amino-4-deoxy-L-arabinose transferase-like glycosyltransferase
VTPPGRVFAHRALAAILVLAALLRILFFVGLVSGDPQDDGIYYSNAFGLYKNGLQYLDLFQNFPADEPVNPIASFHVRPMVTYPTAAAFAVFGPGEISAVVWPFLCSLAIVLVVYRLGVCTHDRSVGLVAALLCAFYPLEVINATRILSDVQVGLFSAVALLLLLEARERDSVVLCVLSGAAAAGAYLANMRSLIFLIALLGCALAVGFGAHRRAIRYAPLWVVAGFACVFAFEAIAYYAQVGDPLLSYHVQGGVLRFKYLFEPVSSVDWGPVRVSYTNGQPLELSRSVLHLQGRTTNQFGYFFVLFFASAIFSLIRRRNTLLLALAAFLCLYLEFGPVQISVDWARRQLHYMMVFKQERFLLVVTAPFAILSAYALRSLAKRRPWLVIFLLVMLFVTSIVGINRTRQFYRAGLRDLRVVTPYVLANPTRTFFGDLWAIEQLNIFTRHQAHNLRVLDAATTPRDIRGACVMLGGGRGVELLSSYVESTLPAFARDVLSTNQAPLHWRLVLELQGAHTDQRLHDFRVYCLP